MTGNGVPKDRKRAIELFERGCESSSSSYTEEWGGAELFYTDAVSCLQLGRAYLAGDGVPRDPKRAAVAMATGCGLGFGIDACFESAKLLLAAPLATSLSRDVAADLLVEGCWRGHGPSCSTLDTLGVPRDKVPDLSSPLNTAHESKRDFLGRFMANLWP
jgi:TPR repeat protein